MDKRNNYMFNTLSAMAAAFDTGQQVTKSSAIGQCRQAMKTGWRFPCDSEAFKSLSIEETKIIFDLLEARSTYYAIYAATNQIIKNRMNVREIEESFGPNHADKQFDLLSMFEISGDIITAYKVVTRNKGTGVMCPVYFQDSDAMYAVKTAVQRAPGTPGIFIMPTILDCHHWAKIHANWYEELVLIEVLVAKPDVLFIDKFQFINVVENIYYAAVRKVFVTRIVEHLRM